MTDLPPRKILEWLSLRDIVKAWSEETGESPELLEREFREWLQEFLVRNAYAEAGAGGADAPGIPAEMIEGRRVWRETFEIFCEERRIPKPRFWFPEDSDAEAGDEPRAAYEPESGPLAAWQPEAARAGATVSEIPLEEDPAPPRRRVREGGSSFTWIALGLVALVAVGLVALSAERPEGELAEPRDERQPGAGQLASAGPAPEELRPAESGEPSAPARGESNAAAPAAEGPAESRRAPPASTAADEQPDEQNAAAPASVEGGGPSSAGPTPGESGAPAPAEAPAAQSALAVQDEPPPAAPPAAAERAAEPPAARAPREPAEAPSSAALPPEPGATPGPAATPGISDEGLVLLVQRELAAAGFDPGPLDGRSGPRVSAAIEDYQRAQGLPVDGRASVDLLSRLARENLQAGRTSPAPPQSSAAPEPPVAAAGKTQPRAEKPAQSQLSARQPASRAPGPAAAPAGRNLVRSIQKRLAARGYYSGAVDGDLGPQTREAIEAYERAHGRSSTGRATPRLYQELEEYAREFRALKLFKQGAFSEAITAYSEIIERKPRDADAYFNRGLAYKNAGFAERALADYDMAIELDSGHGQAYLDRGNIRYQQGRYRAAIMDYLHVLGIWLGVS